jgi:hypothetical protein
VDNVFIKQTAEAVFIRISGHGHEAGSLKDDNKSFEKIRLLRRD